MSQIYRKDSLTKIGNTWYIQFHIQDWMLHLPKFTNHLTNNGHSKDKKNFKRSLRTKDYGDACTKRDIWLHTLGLKSKPPTEPLTTGPKAYWEAIPKISTLPDQELVDAYNQYGELKWTAYPSDDDQLQDYDKTLEDHTDHYQKAIDREIKNRGLPISLDEFGYLVLDKK